MSHPFTVHYVGSPAEVAHHAAPLRRELRVQMTAPEQVVEQARVGDVAVFFSEHFERFRRAIGELRQRGIATLYALDGILEWRHAWENRQDEPACPWTMRPVLSHKVACIGRHQAQILRSWGNGPKVEVVGLPRLDRWAALRGGDDCGDLARQKWNNPEPNQPLRILVVTAKFPGFTPQQIETTRQSLRDLAAWLEAHASIGDRPRQVTWRLTRGLDRDLGLPNSLQDLTGPELLAQIEASDLVISTASTAMLESMLLGRPTVLLDYHPFPTYVPAAWTIRHAGDLDPLLRSAAEADARRMAFQEYLLQEELECSTPALPRLVQLITRLHELSLQHAQSSSSCGGGSRDFQPADSQLTTSELAAWFPEHFGSTERSAIDAAAELAHARREIENLHRRIAQLSSELATAHEIFRQVHAHPIAGPVVRTRQRLLDLVQHWSGQRTGKNGGRPQPGEL